MLSSCLDTGKRFDRDRSRVGLEKNKPSSRRLAVTNEYRALFRGRASSPISISTIVQERPPDTGLHMKIDYHLGMH